MNRRFGTLLRGMVIPATCGAMALAGEAVRAQVDQPGTVSAGRLASSGRPGCVPSNSDVSRDGDIVFCEPDRGDVYLVGDWDGDRRDNLAVRRSNCVQMDTNFDGAHDREQCLGSGPRQDGDRSGDRR